MFNKRRVAILVAEFLGTAILALAVLAVFTSQVPIGYFVALGAGISLFLLVMVFGSVSGAVLNPAITVGLWTVRRITTIRAVGFIIAQLLGGLAAFALYEFLTDGDGTWGNRANGFDAQVLVAEVVGTTVLAFGFAAAIYQRLTGTTRAAVIGGSYAAGILVASIASLGLLNPAIAFTAQTWELTTYVLGPVLGAIIGLNLYNLVFSASTAPVVVKTRSVTSGTVKTTPVATKATATKSATVAKKPAAKKTAATKKK